MTPAHWRFDEVALKGQGWLSFSFQVFPVHIPHCTHDFSPLTTHPSVMSDHLLLRIYWRCVPQSDYEGM